MKLTKKLITSSFVLALLLTHSGSALAAPQSFTDMTEEDQYYPAAEYLFENEIFLGHPDGSFQPDTPLKRGELMAIVVRALEIEPDPAVYQHCYADVEDEWFAPYVCYATEQGWVQGYEGNVFYPENEAKMAEIMKMILYPLFPEDVEFEIQQNIADYGDDAKWHTPYYQISLNKGLYTGDLDFYPYTDNLNPSTRAKTANYLFEALLTHQNNWDMYNDYPRDQLFLEQEKNHLLSTGYPCYPGYSKVTPNFLTQYINDEYDIDHIDFQPWLDHDFLLDPSNLPYFNFTGFCVLENSDHLMFGYSLDEDSSTNQAHLVRFDEGGNLVKDQSIICEEWLVKVMEELPEANLSHIDPETYEMIDCIYAKDAEQVYGMSYLLVDDADPATFEVLDFPHSRDKNHVFYEDITLPTTDPDSYHIFQPLNEAFPISLYSKDSDYVYFWGDILEGADPETFEVIGIPEVPDYWLESDEFFYELVEQRLFEGQYAKDKNNWYLGDDVIEDIDHDTFEVLDFFFSKDKNNVYLLREKSGEYMSFYGLSPLEELDADTFKSTLSPYTEDANGTYFVDRAIEADLDEAELLENPFDIFEFYLKTKDKFFWEEYEVLNITNINDFEFIDEDYAHDGENVYELKHNVIYLDGISDQVELNILEGADPNDFEGTADLIAAEEALF